VTKRLRIFAGPNGSGKSTFIRNFPSAPNLKLGAYVNADDIEYELKRTGRFSFKGFGLDLDTTSIQSYFKDSKFSPVKLNNANIWRHLSIQNEEISLDQDLSINSYLAADLAEFLRKSLLTLGHSFSFETVILLLH